MSGSLFQFEVVESSLNEIKNCFFSDKADIHEMYSQLLRVETFKTASDGFGYAPKDIFKPIFAERLIGDHLVGFDLPIKIRRDGNKKNLIFVGQDPLRNSRDFCAPNKIIFGLPFAIHSPFYKQRQSLYFDLFEAILNSGYNIYLTDVSKIWNGKDRFLRKKDMILHRELLASELMGLDFEVLVAMGNLAISAVEGLNVSFNRKIELPHFNARPDAWRRVGLNEFSHDSKCGYLLERLKNK